MSPEQLAIQIRKFYDDLRGIDVTRLSPADLEEYRRTNDEIRKLRLTVESGDSLAV
jgi:hypothetical protein